MNGSRSLSRFVALLFLVNSVISASNAKSFHDTWEMQSKASDFERKGDFASAEAIHRQILASSVADVDNPFRLHEKQRANLGLARILMKQKKFVEAKKIMQNSFEQIKQEAGPTSEALVKQHYDYVNILRMVELFDEANAEKKIGDSIYEQDNLRRSAQEAISKDREKGLKAIIAGNKNLALASLQTAVAKAEKAGEFNSELPASLLDLGRAELEYGSKAKSVSLLKRSLDLMVKHDTNVYGKEYMCFNGSSQSIGTPYTQSESMIRRIYASSLRATGKAKEAAIIENSAKKNADEMMGRRLGISIISKDGKPIKGVRIKSASGAMDGITGADGELRSARFPEVAMPTIKEFAESELHYMTEWRESLAKTVRVPDQNNGVVGGWDQPASAAKRSN